MVALIGKSRVWLGGAWQPENDVWRGRWMNAFSGCPWVGVMLAESSRSGIYARLCGWNLSGINARPTAFLTALKLRFQVA